MSLNISGSEIDRALRQPIPKYFTVEEVRAILSANAHDLRAYMVLNTFWKTGIRCSELLGLTREVLDPYGKLLRVKTLKQGEKKKVYAGTGRKSKATNNVHFMHGVREAQRSGAKVWVIETYETPRAGLADRVFRASAIRQFELDPYLFFFGIDQFADSCEQLSPFRPVSPGYYQDLLIKGAYFYRWKLVHQRVLQPG